MSNKTNMSPALSKMELPTTANFLGDGAASVGNTSAQAVVREWFAEGARGIKHDALAPAIGVDSSALSQMLSGARQRHIYLVHALPLLESPSTAQAFIGWACRRARLAEPMLLDTVTLSQHEARLLAWMKRTAVWSLFIGDMVAREFYRCDRDLLEIAIENTLRIGK